MPRKKELPAPDSGEQDDLLSTEPQESPNAPLTEPQEEPIPTESPPDEGAPEDDTPSEEYTEFLQALNEAPAQEDPQPAPSDEAEPMPSEEEPALTIHPGKIINLIRVAGCNLLCMVCGAGIYDNDLIHQILNAVQTSGQHRLFIFHDHTQTNLYHFLPPIRQKPVTCI